VEVIDDDDSLYRRVPHVYITRDAPDAGERITSAALKEKRHYPDREISVEIARLTTPADCVSRAPTGGFRVISFVAEVPRRRFLSVDHEPEPDCYAHALITGRITKEDCVVIAQASTIVL
jgi:hypothetical protein